MSFSCFLFEDLRYRKSEGGGGLVGLRMPNHLRLHSQLRNIY